METAHQRVKKIKPVVSKLLQANPIYRDSDEALVARYWVDEFEAAGNNIQTSRAYKFADMVRKGELTSFDNITRAKRKVQEQVPELRGETWGMRHGMSEDFKNNAHNI